MKIYTRGGDKGKTSIIGKARRFKDDIRIEAYGTVDEAGAYIGLIISELEKGMRIFGNISYLSNKCFGMSAQI
ncbi:ATP:cob(I)alamin adenosyltransferase [Neobacillus pocheonensis]|uniref:Corrinoid adenosyltransferase n=1 Tax=Neobacillus pocheonensis TaxID=363869 RepID=A0ABT0WEQ9_9BACI|nr:ATP:cob(I)alamin adenosyltransferase [Neobacillus pocheonensis]